MEISVYSFTGKIFRLEVETSDTFGILKQKIQENEGVPYAQQSLFFCDLERSDERRLSDLWMRNNPPGQLVLRPHGYMEIFVKHSNDLTNTYEINASDTVYSVKEKIQEKEGVPTERFKLVYFGKCLKDERTFADYNIRHLSTLHLKFYPVAVLADASHAED